MQVGDWIYENCNTVGQGDLVLTGALVTFTTFQSQILAGQEVWYSVEDNGNREVGLGTFNGIDTIQRTTVHATMIGNVVDATLPVAPIYLTGQSLVSCTFNALAYQTLLDHLATQGNPHNTVASQIPYDPADDVITTQTNVQDALEEHSTFIAQTSDNLALHVSDLDNPHNVTAIQAPYDPTDDPVTLAINVQDALTDHSNAILLRQPYDEDLTALSSLGGFGFPVRIAPDTWAQRAITVQPRLTIGDGDGVAGNPLIDLAALTADRALMTNGSGFPAASAVTSTELGYISGTVAPIQQQFAGVASTGIRSGGVLSINGGDNTKFDCTAVTAVFITATPPYITYVTAGPFTAQTVTNIGTQNATYVALDINGNLVQFSAALTPSQRRTYAEIGVLIHSNLTNLNAINQLVATVAGGVSQVHDFMEAVGPLNLTGNKYTANGANLNVNVSAGTIHKYGSNFQTDPTNPHRVTTSAGTAITFRYRTQTGAEGADVTAINPNLYDNAGTLTAVPNNKFTVQRITRFQSEMTRIQYGQTVYDSLNEAVASIATETFVTETNIAENGILRAFLVVREDATALNNAAQALFLEVPKFGGAAANAGGALTSANIIAALGYTPANVAGDTFTGNITVSNGTISTRVYHEAVTGAGGVGTSSNHPFAILVNGVEAARFSGTNRNLLVNTTTDDGTNKLQVNGTVKFSGNGLTIDSSGAAGSTSLNLICLNTGSSTINFGGTTNPDKGRIAYSDNSDIMQFFTNDSEKVRITSTGNLLIGTTTDNGVNRLQVAGSAILTTSVQVPLTIQSSDSAAYMRYINSGNSAVYTGSTSSGDFDIQTSATTRARITSGGNFLIGTTTDSGQKFQVSGSSLLEGTAKVYNSSTDAVFRVDSVSARAFTEYQLNSVAKAFVGVGSAADELITGSVAGSLSLRTQGTSMLFTTDSGVNASMAISSGGNVLIGTTTDDGANKLQVNGRTATTGVQFPATQSASSDPNCLDDYEEGTWTPQLQFGGASTGITYSVQNATYTKIGRQVTVMAHIGLSSKGSATGSAQIVGLPFTLGSVSAPAAHNFLDVSYVGTPNLRGVSGDVRVVLQAVAESGASSSLTDTNFTSGSEVFFSLTYFV